MKVALTGAGAVAHAMRQINPDVVAAFPITPQTPIMQKFSDFQNLIQILNDVAEQIELEAEKLRIEL